MGRVHCGQRRGSRPVRGAVELPWDAEGRADPAGCIRAGMLSLEGCTGVTASIRCGKTLAQGAFGRRDREGEELWRTFRMLGQDAVVGGFLLGRILCSRLPSEGKILTGSGSHPGSRDPLSEAAVGGGILAVWGPSCPGCAGRRCPASRIPLWWDRGVTSCPGGDALLGQGVHTRPGTRTPPECCLEESQARKEYKKGFSHGKDGLSSSGWSNTVWDLA